MVAAAPPTGPRPSTWSGMLSSLCGSSQPAVISAQGIWSGDELMRRAAGCADWLDAILEDSGSPVPALLTANPSALALVVAGSGSGHPIAPLGPRLTARELMACVEALECPVLVAEPEFVEVASEVVARTGLRLEVLAEPACSQRRLDFDPSNESTAFVLHTSGTTGMPKAVAYRQDRLARRVGVSAAVLSLGPDSVYASASPFHHIAGLGNQAVALAVGAAVVTMARFSIDEWARTATAAPTHVLLVPTVIEMLLDAGALGWVPSLRVLQYGASPIQPGTLRRAMETLPTAQPVQMFGQTEGSPITCLTPTDHALALSGDVELLGSVGRAAPGVEVRIDQPDEAGIGEVCARAPHFFGAGADGWLRTGDLGFLDRRSYLFLVGRSADMIIRGGENVYPIEVEEVLRQNPSVRDAAVVGVPDGKWGEVVRAFIVPTSEGAEPTEGELRRFARERLAGFKVPSLWTFLDEIPRNSSGKVVRRSLRLPPGQHGPESA
jgi:acyl-CoA synthetase (AMP-forming)/AMP-acid ligase II